MFLAADNYIIPELIIPESLIKNLFETSTRRSRPSRRKRDRGVNFPVHILISNNFIFY